MTVNSGEYLTSLGVDSVYVAEVTQDDAAAYVAGTPQYLAPTSQISGAPTLNETILYYDDAAYEVINTEGKTERKITISALPPEMEALLLGEEFDTVLGRLYDNAKPSAAPYFALGYRAQKSDGTYRYYWWLKGKFSKPATDHATYGESPDPKPVELTYSAVKTVFQFDLGDVNDGCKRVVGDDATTNFDETGWFSAVQSPAAGTADALTCTPVPADGATNVVVTADITLTFNNRIRTGDAGIVLTKSDGSSVASVYTWNAAVKVLTINPNSSLAAGADYLIVLSGVTDIYGQTLANAIYNFTTAS